MFAYCFASGHIEFGHFLPDYGALPIAKGDDRELRGFISGVAEHSRSQKDMLLVPGIPYNKHGEPEQMGALDALQKWLGWIGAKPPKGIFVFGNRPPPTKRNRRRAKMQP